MKTIEGFTPGKVSPRERRRIMVHEMVMNHGEASTPEGRANLRQAVAEVEANRTPLSRSGGRHTPHTDIRDRLRIPRRFYDDHRDRGLPTPPPVKTTARHVWIDPAHPATADLLSDAQYYATEARYMGQEYFGLGVSAGATVTALSEGGDS